jgi:hypothetical protein
MVPYSEGQFGVNAMTDYRIYLLNETDHIYSFRVASSESDDDVLDIAQPLLAEATAVEIWQRTRRVARLPGIWSDCDAARANAP